MAGRHNRERPAGGKCSRKLGWWKIGYRGVASRAVCFGSFYKNLSLKDSTFADRLQAVESRIEAALRKRGRTRSDLTLVAVSKKFSAGHLREAYRAGARDFGENYVQEFAEKKTELGELPEARFHLIGHLQSNKARLACELFDVIQTADSVKLLERLDAAAEQSARLQADQSARLQEVLLEVKLSAEASKTGALPEHLPALLQVAGRSRKIRVTGLMTVPPWSEDAEQSRPYFRTLAELARQYALPQLSMGMSNDFEVAIEEGATIVRIGTALFGPRPKPLERKPEALLPV